MVKDKSTISKVWILLLKLVVLGVFCGGLLYAITSVNQSMPTKYGVDISDKGKLFSEKVINAHYRWLAQERPEMIMLPHYNKSGAEVGRTFLRMARYGWPNIERNDDGCARLWRQLLNEPNMLDGLKVFSDYYGGKTVDGKQSNAICRYRLGTGPHFDYKLYTGEVIISDK